MEEKNFEIVNKPQKPKIVWPKLKYAMLDALLVLITSTIVAYGFDAWADVIDAVFNWIVLRL